MRINKYYPISYLNAMERLVDGQEVYVLNPYTDEVERLYKDDMLVKYKANSIQHLMNLKYFKKSNIIAISKRVDTVISTKASRISEVEDDTEFTISNTTLTLVV